MYRVLAVVVMVWLAAAAAAQTMKDLDSGPEAPSSRIPEVPAGDDPMDRQPDRAADSPGAKTLQQPAGSANGGASCRVRRADTDTGFVVVCEESDGG